MTLMAVTTSDARDDDVTGTGGRPLGSQYHLDFLIGRGGMGEVWRGTDSEGNALAFKLLQPQFAEDGEIIRRFLGERQLLTGVRHPNVVGVRDMVAEGGTLAIVMELIEGTDLRHHLREHGTLAPAEACRITRQIAVGLAAIHANRIVHRDIKPENILLDKTVAPPQVKLTDFGVARLVEESPAQSKHTVLAGTPVYMAPEVINAELPTPKSDLYALGIVLYELVCGVTPFAGLAIGPMMQAHITKSPGRPAGIDDRLWSLIAQLVSKEPSQRPGDAAVVVTELEYLSRWLVGRPALSRLSTPPPPQPAASPFPTTTQAGSWVAATQVAAHRSPEPPYPWAVAGNPATSPVPIDPFGPTLGVSVGQPVLRPMTATAPRPHGNRVRNTVVGIGFTALVLGGAGVSANTLGLFDTPAATPTASLSASPTVGGPPVSAQATSPSPHASSPQVVVEEPNASQPTQGTSSLLESNHGSSGLAVPPVGAWLSVLASLPQSEHALSEAQALAEQLSVPGHEVVVIDSTATPGLNGGYWAVSAMSFETRESAVAVCASFSRPVGGSCYPRLVG